MDELRVTFAGRTLELRPEERLGIGRSNTDPHRSVGWGYPGRFLELSHESYIHRLWAEILCRHGMWCVRSMGSVNPVRVVLQSGSVVELPPLTDGTRELGTEPETLAVAPRSFVIELDVAAERFEVACAWGGPLFGGDHIDLTGSLTTELGRMVADSISEVEFRVLHVMSDEYRRAAAGGELPDRRRPAPLSYSRVQRRLGLATSRQATSAVERLVRRFRDAGLLPKGLASEEQRARICELAVAHRILDVLAERYGPVPAAGAAAPAGSST